MKKLLPVLLLIISTLAFSQNYKPFYSSTKKLFADFTEMQSTYSMAFDSVIYNGSDSLYYNFYKLPQDFNFVSEDCEFWPGPECWRQNEPVWIGDRIESDNLHSYKFYPDNGDTIHFNFSPISGEPSVFYQDSVQEFLLSYEGVDTISVLNYFDSARVFNIHHADLEGNTINSTLNNQNIEIGKSLGLIQFFQVDSFPQVLKPLHLIGNENPKIGITNITNEMVYDWQPGDEFQYSEHYYWYNGGPIDYYTEYRKHRILERIETSDYLTYLIEEQTFHEDSLFINTDTIQKIYYRYETIAELPFELFDGYERWFYRADYCEFSNWTYNIKSNNGLIYCEADNVWGDTDTFGPPDEIELTYVLGLGTYYDKLRIYDGHFSVFHGTNKIMNYFKKDGVTCGDLVVGIEEYNEISSKVNVNPNPANSLVHFSADEAFTQISLMSSTGKVISSTTHESKQTTIDVSRFPDGIYFAKIELHGKMFITKKIIVLKN